MTEKVSRRPGTVTGLYLGACAVFAAVTLAVGGLRLPSSILFVTFLTGVALAWTLDVLVRYAADTRRLADATEIQMGDTRRIAEAAIEQRNLTHRPCVVIKKFSLRDPLHVIAEQAHEQVQQGFPGMTPARPSAAKLPMSVELENVGPGPALDVELRRVNEAGVQENATFYPHLSPGSSTPVVLPLGFEVGAWGLEVEYAGLSGIRFVSRYKLDDSVVREFSTAAVKLST